MQVAQPEVLLPYGGLPARDAAAGAAVARPAGRQGAHTELPAPDRQAPRSWL